ncbi:MAG: thioredoxin family protein [Ignavibacteria bacterium]
MPTQDKRKTFGEIIRTEPLVIVYFTAEWCGPCQSMKPLLKQLVSEIGKKALFLKLDVDKNQEASSVYNVQGVPTFILFKNGKIVWRQSGAIPAALIRQAIEQNL